MPIEIKELIIRATIDEGGRRNAEGTAPLDERERRRIVSECAEQVVALLERKRER